MNREQYEKFLESDICKENEEKLLESLSKLSYNDLSKNAFILSDPEYDPKLELVASFVPILNEQNELVSANAKKYYDGSPHYLNCLIASIIYSFSSQLEGNLGDILQANIAEIMGNFRYFMLADKMLKENGKLNPENEEQYNQDLLLRDLVAFGIYSTIITGVLDSFEQYQKQIEEPTES